MDALLRIEDSTYALGQKRRSLCARWSEFVSSGVLCLLAVAG